MPQGEGKSLCRNKEACGLRTLCLSESLGSKIQKSCTGWYCFVLLACSSPTVLYVFNRTWNQMLNTMELVLVENTHICISVSACSCLNWFFGDSRWVAWFGSFWKMWANSVQAKWNHLQAGSSKICFMVKMKTDLWSEGYFGSVWVGDNAQGRSLWSLNFRFMRSKSSSLKRQKIWCVDVEMGSYLWRYKFFVKEVYWWNVASCMCV